MFTCVTFELVSFGDHTPVALRICFGNSWNGAGWSIDIFDDVGTRFRHGTWIERFEVVNS